MAVLAAVGAVAGSARADRAAAERAAAEAERTKDPAAFVACGQAFLDTYNVDPTADRNDEVLFNAGRCFEEGRAISAALQMHALVIKSFPNSKLVAKSTALSGRMYEQIAMFDRAAERYESYATRYAGEKDAADTLANAIRLRAALGDTAKQIADTKLWIRMYGAKNKRAAARADYALLDAFDGDAAIAHVRAYLKDYGAEDPDLTIAAHVALADRLRTKSCPVRAIDGLCLKVVAVKGPHCGAGATNLVAVTRSAENREARAEYASAVALADVAKDPAARHAQAMARLALADDDLETMLALPFPRDLDVMKKDGQKRFSQWLDAETKLGGKLTNAYSAVVMQKDATSSVAAAARISRVSQVFWRALMLGELPKAMRVEPQHTAYCDAMKTVADPLRARAIEAASVCIEKAIELQAGHDWAEVCRRDGAALDPDAFIPVSELHGAPSEVAAPIATEPPTE